MEQSRLKGRLVAIITGVFSILIGITYLIMISILDARGPMLPPPPEALGEVAAVFFDPSGEVQQLGEMPTL